MQKLAKVISILTVAPLMALVLLSWLYCADPALFGGLFQYLLAVLFLVVLPILAYPLQKILPPFRSQGRPGQRKLAFLMAVLGYTLGIVCAAIARAPKALWLIYLTYFFSGLLLTLLNRLTKVRASGHACGVAGPVALLIYMRGAPALPMLLLLPLVYWARLAMKRHTPVDLVWGTLTPLLALLLSLLLCGF